MDSTKKLVDDLFAMKMFHCANCKGVLQIPVMLVENLGNVCRSCYDSIKSKDNLVALENTFVNTMLEKVEIPCENESQGCSRRIPYKEIQRHKQQCIYQRFHCMAPEECSWTGCLKDFEIHYRVTHKSYQLHSQNDHFSLGTSLGELKEGLYLLQTSCGDFFLSVNKTNQDVAFSICDIDKSIDDVEYNFSVTFSNKNATKFSSDCKITDWKSFITEVDDECFNKAKINLEYVNCIFHNDILSIEVSLNVKNEYITHESVLLKNLRCENCKFYVKKQIYSGPCGHNICVSCNDKNNKCCGNCTVRNAALEKVVRTVRFPCSFKDKGCPVKISVKNSRHELSCPYNDLECIVSKCGFTGPRLFFINHVQQRHEYTSCRYILTSKAARDNFFLIVDNLVFQVSHENSFPDCVKWSVNIVGSKQYYGYYYLIKIKSLNNITTFKAPHNSLLKLTYDMLQQVGYNGSHFLYMVEVLKH